MITIIIHATIKQGMLDEYLNLIEFLSKKTSKKGCVRYSFNQRKDNPREFVLYEQWESEDDLNNHIAQLFEIFGPSESGNPVPDKIMNMYESVIPIHYNVIAES